MRTKRIALFALALALACYSGYADARGGGGFGGGGGRGMSGGGHIGGGGHGGGLGGGFGSAPKIGGGFSNGSFHSTPHIETPSRDAPVFHANPVTPSRNNFDSDAARATHAEQSAAKYREAHPAPATPPPYGSQPPVSRPVSAEPPYRPHSPAPSAPVVVHQDNGISPWFWIWLMDHNSNRDEWVYHHRDQISEQQMQELRRRDAGLDDRLRRLEQSGVQRDPSIKVDGIDERAHSVAPSTHHSHAWLWIGITILILALFYWLVFVHKFQVRRPA
jgi:hypothetical protein